MRKQCVYNQHQSMACTLWGPHPPEGRQAAEKPSLTTRFGQPAFPSLSDPSIGAFGLQAIFFGSRPTFLFCDTLSRWAEGGSGLPRTTICSQVPQKYHFLNIDSFSFLGSSELTLLPALAHLRTHPQTDGSPKSTDPKLRQQVPLLLTLGHRVPFDFEIICHTDSRTWANSYRSGTKETNWTGH